MSIKKNTQVSDQAVINGTGKTLKEWFGLIDQHHGADLTHKEIAAMLREQSSLGGWWQQKITVEYEIARGKRKPHEMLDGFQISKSKTIPTNIEQVYNAWIDIEKRKQWLTSPNFTIQKATKNKSLRITYIDSKSHLYVYFYTKKAKTQLTTNHKKLYNSSQAEKMNLYWGEQFDQLIKFLE